jgi:glycosyltransferase involved in cell wall biosynthesis
MRVLHVAPLWFPVSRDSVGGIETFLAGLLGALAGRGVEVGLVAAGDSRTAATLVPAVAEGVFARMAAGTALEYAYYEQDALLLALEHARGFDVVHAHVGASGFVLSARPGPPVLHTWHTQVYLDVEWFVRRHPDLSIAAVSGFQASRLRRAGARRCSLVPNGVDVGSVEFSSRPSSALVFVGRLDATKGPDLAVRTARALDLPLTLAGPITDRAFFARAIEPELHGAVRYVGVVDHAAKAALLRGAGCVLMPSRVDEACPMVSLEAMAGGTPVVALARGALPEIVEPGVTGYVADDPDSLPLLVTQAFALDRAAVRARAAARFDLGTVAARYEALYRAMLVERTSRAAAA